MKRVTFFAYGVLCHLLFLVVYLYFVAFTANWFVPRSIDSGPSGTVAWAVVVDLALLLLV